MVEPASGTPPLTLSAVRLPQVTLDDLLAELQARLQAVVDTRDRVHTLLEAILAVGSNLDVESVLHRILDAAVTLVDARYGALGLISEDGTRLSQFLVSGIDDGLAARIGPLPEGRGVLGEVIRDPRPLRLHDLGQHPASFGLPPGHPPMRTFLGVPLRGRDRVLGNLYLTEKRDGADFDDEDEAILLTLAAAAGVAVQNARLFDASLRREQWLQASSEVSTTLLSGSESAEVLALVARRAREVARSDLALVGLPLDGDRLLVEVADGPDAGELLGRILAIGGTPLAQVSQGGLGMPLSVGDIPGAGGGFAVPLAGHGQTVHGVLAVTGLPVEDAAGALLALERFAAHASVALELADRRRDAERFAVFEDRDRIARDLHDLVIQRLFATGMQLQSAVRLMSERPEESQSRVNRAVDELDVTIRELRSTIYGLQAPAAGPSSLRALILQVSDAGAEQLGFAPSVQFDGLLDTLVPPEIAEHALAALREGLSNAARHAEAREVEVLVSAHDGELVVEVNDNGSGLPAGSRRSGLNNLAERARLLGGQFVAQQTDTGGTTVSWRVPLPPRGGLDQPAPAEPAPSQQEPIVQPAPVN